MIYPEFSVDELITACTLIRDWHQPSRLRMLPQDRQILRVIETLDTETFNEMVTLDTIANTGNITPDMTPLTI